MKKNLIYIQIALWTAIALFGLGVLGYSMATEVTSKTAVQFTANQQGLGTAEESFTISPEDIGKIEVDLVSEDVLVSIGDQQDIEVIHYSTRKISRDNQLQLKTSSNTLRITKNRRIQLFHIFPSKERIEIKVPKALVAQLDIEVVSGDLNIEGEYSSLNLITVSGDQYLNNVVAEKIKQDTTSGDLNLEQVSLNQYTAKSISGEINSYFDKMPKEIQAETISGDIELTLPNNDGFVVDYSTVSGDFESKFDIDWQETTKTKGNGMYQSTANEITLKTISGDLDLNH